MNEKLLRLILILVGVAALALFGGKMVDFVRNPTEYKGGLSDEELVRIRRGFSSGAAQATPVSHLEEYPAYSVIQDLNITGYVPPVEVDTGPIEPVRRGISARDLEVPFVQYPNAAWIQPAGAQTVSGSETVPGDLRVVGETFEVDTHRGTELKLAKVELDKITLEVVGADVDPIVVRVDDMPLDMDELLGSAVDGGTEMPRLPTPELTAAGETPGTYLIGKADAKELSEMSEEELLSSVTVRPHRDPLTNQVDGLTVKRLNHPVFQRMGLQQEDIVKSVNGKPALDRDEIVRSMRDFQGEVITLEVERLGGLRTIRYRLPN